jgi:phosphoketolase
MFVSLVEEGARLRFVDGMLLRDDMAALKTLACDRGLQSREEAEVFFSLDRMMTKAGTDWDNLFVDAVAGYIAWQERPSGRIGEEAADWLIACVGDKPTTRGLRLLLRLTREVEDCPPRLVNICERWLAGPAEPIW